MNTTPPSTLLPLSALLPHPKGLFYLAFTETWERFSYYGMTSLLALYMVDELLLPAHAAQVVGYQELRECLNWLSSSTSAQALASQIFGIYSALVYFTPLLGGMVADRFIGQRNAVIIGALSMSAGHIAMAFDRTFLLALLLLIVGSGFLKGNISAQVGALYPRDDEARRTRGFLIFSTGINAGAVLGPLVCGLLAQAYGWHYGFGIAAVLMLVGLATYLIGYRHLPSRVARRSHENTVLEPADWRIVRFLVVLILISIFQSTSYYQMLNVLPIWIEHQVRPDVAGFRIPVPWYLSINALASIVGVPALLWIGRRQAAHGAEPGDIAKIGIGAWIAAISSLILVGAASAAGNALVNPLWPFLCSVGMGVAFLYQWPTLLALVSRTAPAKLNSSMMGITFLSLFISGLAIGWVGGLYERLSPAEFWALNAAIAACGGLLIWLCGRRLAAVLNAG